MLREIYEQPQALRETIERSVAGAAVFSAALKPLQAALGKCARLIIGASGSSRNAGLAGEIMIEELSGVAVDVEYASEYSERPAGTAAETVVMVISQSGETADAIAALRQARKRGVPTIGVTNVAGSTIAREAGVTLLTHASPELAVPATKSFTTQLGILYLLAVYLARTRRRMDAAATRRHVRKLHSLAGRLDACLSRWDAATMEAARRFHRARAFLFIGRGVHYAIAREGALKLKEISYSHAEGYPAGELLHGPNALLSEESVVIALATCCRQDAGSVTRYKKTRKVLEYVKARGGRAMVIATEGDRKAQALGDSAVFVPAMPELLLPLVEVVPLQLFAYHIGVLNGCDVDQPRNLVKSVVRT